MLLSSLGAIAPACLCIEHLWAGETSRGVLVGEPTAERVAARVLAEGGNAFDAAVAGGLAAALSSPYQFGIGGYGGHATLFSARQKTTVSIDFNTSAPAEARADMFPRQADSEHGWLAAGVPGILAGLQLVLDNHGTRKLPDVIQPAIALARNGVVVDARLASAIAASAKQFAIDPASRKLYFQDDRPLRVGERLRNPELADMLTTLAQRGSVQSFYRGDIAQRIADGFRKNGGLVTARDMARFTAREERPLSLTWDDLTIHTAPLTAGGMTFMQALRILQAMHWQRLPAGLPQTHGKIEAMRLAWRDRLTLLGDPQVAKAPVERLLSDGYVRECAARIEQAVKEGRVLTQRVSSRDHTGTINLSAADRDGNFIAITLTHGNGFGARVTAPGLGLTLGHGMSRFDTDPAHPNAPGPSKKPLNNMCPTVVLRQGQPVLALGGRGGRRIQNAMYEALVNYVALGRPLAASLAAPRFHTEGSTALGIEKTWPAAQVAALEKLGYRVQAGVSVVLSAVAIEKDALTSGMR
jgi:gamma-glutamyltranspeptidase/glutathione hydrolase